MPKMKQGEIKKLTASELSEVEQIWAHSLAEKSLVELKELAKVYSISNMTIIRNALLYVIELRETIENMKREVLVLKSRIKPIDYPKSPIFEPKRNTDALRKTHHA